MASLEDLPADQRAVLQMVLQRGRTYDEIANLLSIDRSAVRQRALDAFDALTPDGIEAGPEQALVTDYLLSQLPEQVAEQVYIYLEAADGDRGWAGAIADRLGPLAAKPLPEVPVAAPLRSDQPAVADEPYARYGAPQPGPLPPAPPASQPPAAQAPPPAKSAPAPRPERARSAPTGVRRRRSMLVAGVGVVTVILAVVVVVLLGSSSPSAVKPRRTYTYTPTGTTTAPTNTTTSGTTTTNTGPQILAAFNLTSPVGATQTLGVAQVVRDDGVVGIVIDAQGVPANSAKNAYAVWLYNSATSHEFVGFDPNLVGKNEKLAIEGTLPAGASHFKHLLITLETEQHPKTPGEVVLSGVFSEK